MDQHAERTKSHSDECQEAISETDLSSNSLETGEKLEISQDIEIPDGGYGWLVCLACFLYNFSTWGANAGYAVYYQHYLASDMFPAATNTDYSLIGGFAIGLGVMFSSFYTYLVGRIGTRTVIIMGNVLTFLAMISASFASKLWQLYITQGVLQGVGLALVAIPSMTLLPQWFRKRRTLAMGISSGGCGAGGILFNLAMQRIIEVKSLAWALRSQAIICAVLSTIAITLTRTRAEHIKPEFIAIDTKVLRSFGFHLQALWCIFTMFGYVVLLYNLGDFTRSLGYSSYQGSIVSSMVSVGATIGRPIVGMLSDRFGVVTVEIYVHFIVGILALSMWISTRNYATCIVYAILQGGMMGSIWVTIAPITARIVGLRKLNITMGMLWFFLGASSLVSPVIGIQLKSDPPRGKSSDPKQYLFTSIFVGVCYLISGVILIFMRGWISARDSLAIAESDSDNGNELDINIPIANIISSSLSFNTTRKV